MEILRTIAVYAEAKALDFAVIGGHAVNHYGISRQTGDLDLIVKKVQRDEWIALFERLNYTSTQSDDRFIKWRPDQLAAWPVDLMFVDDQTFNKLFLNAETGDLGVATGVKIVSARHLVTLKLHALKHFQEHRFAKDYQDVLGLLRSGKTDLTESDIKDLCVRYAYADLYEQLKRDMRWS